MDQHIVCGKCTATNRMPTDRAASAAKCGKCGTALFAGHPDEVDGPGLDRHVAHNTIPVLVDVWAPWCGPCRAMAPAYAAAARELEPNVRLLKLNSDIEQTVAARLGINSIPTMILFQSGREIGRQSGAMSSNQLVQWVRRLTP